MKKTTIIDGQEFELRDLSEFTGTDKQQFYALKPIEPAKEEVEVYKLKFWEEYMDDLVVAEYLLTKTEAQAVAEAIEAVMEYISDEKVNYFIDYIPRGKYSPKFDKARRLIQQRKDI